VRVIQILPELNAGGVERGTVEFARHLVQAGHESIVISAGGRMTSRLTDEGSQHIEMPVHRKRLGSLRYVRPLRRLLMQLDADIVHLRSRVPAWLTWLAIGRMPRSHRPAIVTTFHGLYSVNAYSAIMGRGDAVIAISECVRDYILENYPKVPRHKVSVVHRGVDAAVFNRDFIPSDAWIAAFYAEFPHLRDKPLVLMPGRLSRWKGQEGFITLMAILKQRGIDCHGVVVGGPTPGKEAYERALHSRVKTEGLEDRVTFVGHRSDILELYSQGSVVCNLSEHPEPFGRTIIEALALGIPAVAFDVGGPAESLRACLPQGLAPPGDLQAMADKVETMIMDPPGFSLPRQFTLAEQAGKTLAIYRQLLDSRVKATPPRTGPGTAGR